MTSSTGITYGAIVGGFRFRIQFMIGDISPGLAVAYVGFRQSYFLGPGVVGKASLGQVRLFKGMCVT